MSWSAFVLHANENLCYFFFFPSRRRHTIFSRDWSSDVCSSDLDLVDDLLRRGAIGALTVDVAAEVVDDDLGALAGEQEGVLAAPAAARAGDDCNPPVERTHGSSPRRGKDAASYAPR